MLSFGPAAMAPAAWQDLYSIVEVVAPGNKDCTGKVQRSAALVGGEVTAVIPVLGQSNGMNSVTSTLYTASLAVQNFNFYDGRVYDCVDPLLGCQNFSVGHQGNVCGRIGDKIVGAGYFQRAIFAPTNIGDTKASDWQSSPSHGVHYNRVVVLCRQLRNAGLTPTFILWLQGESDNVAVTAGAAYTASVQSVAQVFRDFGFTAPFFVPRMTYAAGVTSATIRTAQDNCVSVPLNIVAGPDIDALSGPTYRDATDTHFNDVGSDAHAELWRARIQSYLGL